MPTLFHPARRVVVVAVAAALLTAAVGCGPQTATVSGKVTVNGEPLKAGALQFQSASGVVVDAPINEDGTYTAVNVPVGTAKVSISAMDPKFEKKMLELVGRGKPSPEGQGAPAGAGRGKPMTAADQTTDWAEVYRLVDEKFSKFETSGLTVNVVGPTTTYDVPATKTKKGK